MSTRPKTKSLVSRILIPLLLLCMVGGIGLYYAVQSTFAKFTARQLGQFLSSMANTVYMICDGGGHGLMSEPQPRDPRALRIRQARALGAIENHLRQNGLIGFVMTPKRSMVLNTELAPDLQVRLLEKLDGKVAMISYGGRRYAVVHVQYRPWGWTIVIARERRAFAALMQDIRGLYLHMAILIGIVVLAFLFVMEEVVRRPVRSIIETIRGGGTPVPTGIAEFDFLTEQLQEALRKKHALIGSLEKTHFIYTHGVDGNFVDVSPSITDILGYSPDEFKTHYSAYLTDHPVNREVERRTTLSIQGQTQPPYEVEIYHKDGNRRWLEVAEVPVFDNGGSVVAVEGIARDITEKKQVEQERELMISELQKAMAEIKTLRGIIPICASCKKVRDDAGAWQQVEAYIRDHSDAQFSHGICPDCLEKTYPEFSEKKKDR